MEGRLSLPKHMEEKQKVVPQDVWGMGIRCAHLPATRTREASRLRGETTTRGEMDGGRNGGYASQGIPRFVRCLAGHSKIRAVSRGLKGDNRSLVLAFINKDYWQFYSVTWRMRLSCLGPWASPTVLPCRVTVEGGGGGAWWRCHQMTVMVTDDSNGWRWGNARGGGGGNKGTRGGFESKMKGR
jgi:hypothetical protein